MRSEVTVIFQSSPPVRQWVLSVPKRLRYFLQRDGAALNTALRIFLRVSTGLRSEGQLLAGLSWKGRACRLVVVDLPYV
ncbi:MAG TPA: hypothetical protein VFW43_09360 [Polaromonas sp.]|nr:hypothetical protein [Polaromonas sp.]